jgi:hypothetical protein
MPKEIDIQIAVILLFAISIFSGDMANASGIKDRLLILPPHVSAGYDGDTNSLWRTIYGGYEEGVARIEVIPMPDVIAAMEGDTLSADLVMLDDAIEWGQHFDADYVVMAETRGSRVAIQRLDPWTAELFGPVEADNALAAVRSFESDHWVFGRNLLPTPDGYSAPLLEHSSSAITAWIHENREYPPDAMIELLGCYASVGVSVSPEGVPLDIRIYSVDQKGFGFEEAIAKALWTMRFTPAHHGDKFVHGMWISTVDISPTM